MTVGEALALAAGRLEIHSETPRLDAEILLAGAMGLNRAQLLARLSDAAPAAPFWEWIARREAFEPLAYILGEWEFFSLPILCRAPVLVPRPETEHLVEGALDAAAARRGAPLHIADLGTGTGCVALALAHHLPGARVLAVDVNPEAARLAQKNARRLELSQRVGVVCGEWFEALGARTRPFDIVAANPPYVEDEAWAGLSPVITRYEDARALLAGPDGLGAIRRILRATPRLLSPGGVLLIEAGAGQAKGVAREARAAGWQLVGWRKDLAGHDRTAELRLGE